MIEEIKSILDGFECRVVEAKRAKNCFYVTYINRDPVDIQKHSDRTFASRLINLFKQSRRISRNHYFVDMNNIDIEEVNRFVSYLNIAVTDLSQRESIHLNLITRDIVEDSGCTIGCQGGEWVHHFDCGFDMLVFNAQELAVYAMDQGFNEVDFSNCWIKEILESEIEPHTKVIESDQYKHIGSKKENVEFTTFVKDVFRVHPEKYHVLVETYSEDHEGMN